ncbi:MAG: patatin-like phospholipase family protein [Candidatus Eiseniibacteriota bacterium]
MPIRALVMSGGGAKGAFQVGAVDTLVHERQLDFQVVAGVSAGALNALVLAQAKGPEGLRSQIEVLKRLWLGIDSDRDIYRHRFLGQVLAFVMKDSVHDPSPLREKIERFGRIDDLRGSSREFRIGVSWLETGGYESIDQNHEAIHACTLASSSMPVLFPPVPVGDRSGVDGGVRSVTPLDEAFDALKHLHAISPNQELEMYVLLASPLSMVEERGPWKTGLKIGKRALSMLINEIYREDLRYALAINNAVRSHVELRTRLVERLGAAVADGLLDGLEFPYSPPKYQYVRVHAVVPDREFSDALEFDPQKIRQAFEAGRSAARNLLDDHELAAQLRKSPEKPEAQAA